MKKLLILLFSLFAFTLSWAQQQFTYQGNASGTSTYTASITNLTSYGTTRGVSVDIFFVNASASGNTLNINGLGAIDINGAIAANTIYHLAYNTVSGDFDIVGGAGGAGDEVTSNKVSDLSTFNSTLYPATEALFGTRAITVSDDNDQIDNGKIIYFDCGAPCTFTLDALTINSNMSLVNKSTGSTVTIADGSGVTHVGATSLAAGATASVLYESSTAPIVISGGGGSTGDVVGPGSAVNNNVVFFDGTTGKLIKDSGLALSGSNTGDQTTVTGNAGTATALQTPRTIGTVTGDATSAGSSFDGSANNTNALTLATVNSNVGSFGSSTSIPSITVNGKGLITAASGNAVVAPAGTLSGATLNSGVTASSLTSFGTSPTIVTPSITTGFTIGGAAVSRKMMVGNGTNFVPSTETWAVPGTSGNILSSDGTNWTSVAGSTIFWLSASGATLSAANTVSSTTPNGLRFTAGHTTTASDQNGHAFGGTIVPRATANDNIYGAIYDYQIDQKANGQSLIGVQINPTFGNAGGFSATGSTYAPLLIGTKAAGLKLSANSVLAAGAMQIGSSSTVTGTFPAGGSSFELGSSNSNTTYTLVVTNNNATTSIGGVVYLKSAIGNASANNGSTYFGINSDGAISNNWANSNAFHGIRFANTLTANGAGANTFTIFNSAPTINATAGTLTTRVLDYLPVETSLTGVTQYGVTIGGTNAFNGFNTRTPNSTTHVNGSWSGGYVAKTGTYTATALDYTIECTANTFTVTLPTAVGITGRIYNISNSGAGTITIGTTSSQTFINVTATPTTLTLATVGSVTVQSNGSGWLQLR